MQFTSNSINYAKIKLLFDKNNLFIKKIFFKENQGLIKQERREIGILSSSISNKIFEKTLCLHLKNAKNGFYQ